MTSEPAATGPSGLRQQLPRLLSKVPEVTLYFWLIKVLCLTVGETVADYLDETLGLGLTDTTVVMGLALLVMLGVQFRARRYVPWIYWSTVALVSVVGTLIADTLTDGHGVPTTTTTPIFAILLAVTFLAWWLVEGTLSIRSIRTPAREAFYWLAILVTFALGTAGGDMLAEQLGMGYPTAVLIFAGAIGVVCVARFGFGMGPVPSFWLAYILTRPLGASIGDWLSQPGQGGALGLGTTATSVIFLGVILALVVFLTVTRIDVLEEEVAPEEGISV